MNYFVSNECDLRLDLVLMLGTLLQGKGRPPRVVGGGKNLRYGGQPQIMEQQKQHSRTSSLRRAQATCEPAYLGSQARIFRYLFSSFCGHEGTSESVLPTKL